MTETDLQAAAPAQAVFTPFAFELGKVPLYLGIWNSLAGPLVGLSAFDLHDDGKWRWEVIVLIHTEEQGTAQLDTFAGRLLHNLNQWFHTTKLGQGDSDRKEALKHIQELLWNIGLGPEGFYLKT